MWFYLKCDNIYVLRYLFIFIILIAATLSNAQTRGRIPTGVGNSGNPPGSIRNGSNNVNPFQNDTLPSYIKRDSFIYNYFTLDNIFRKKVFRDTANTGDMDRYDKSQSGFLPRLFKGNNGSASLPMVLQTTRSAGFNTGYTQYEAYRITLDSFKFYESNRPIADLSFSPIVGSQDNFIVAADYGQQFAEGIAMSVNYHRVNQKGFYTGQGNKTTNFGFGLKKESMRGKLNTFFIGIVNNSDEAQNGGVSVDTLFNTQNYNFRSRIPVFRSNSISRLEERDLSLINIFRLGDSIVEASDIIVKHRLSVTNNRYKFADSTLEGGSSYYGKDFWHDDRGIRVNNKFFTLSNSFSLFSTSKGGFNGELGIIHDYIKIDDGLQSYSRNDITSFAQGVLPIKDLFQLNVNAKLGLGSNIGRFYIDGSAMINLKKWATLNFGTSLFNIEPGNNMKSLVITNKSIFTNDFSNINGLSFYGNLNIPTSKTSLSFKQSVFNNFIYLDDNQFPRSLEGILSQSTLTVDQKFKLGSFHNEYKAMLQSYSSNEIRLPSWSIYGTLYWQGKLFRKVLDARVGLERHMLPSYTRVDYSPVNGTFYNDGRDLSTSYNYTNAFFTGKISTFRIFVMIENLEDYWSKNIYYQIGSNPMYDNRVRFGIRWLLLD